MEVFPILRNVLRLKKNRKNNLKGLKKVFGCILRTQNTCQNSSTSNTRLRDESSKSCQRNNS
jgi:hypothetical protein